MPTRGSVAIIGAAESEIGAVAALMSPIDLMAQGIHRALADAGLALRDVDGVFCATTQARTSAMSLVEYLGLPDAYTDSTIVGGSSFEIHVAHAHAALEAGLCTVAVIAYGSTQRTVGRRQASVREYNPYETPYRPFLPASAYAMAASRHMFEFGTTREQLAEVAVAAREWALLNPAAWEKLPLRETQRGLPDVIRAAKRRERLTHTAEGLARSLASVGLGQMPDLRPKLAQTPCTVEFLVGAHDTKFVALAQELCHIMPRARVAAAAHAGHDLLLERPDFCSTYVS